MFILDFVLEQTLGSTVGRFSACTHLILVEVQCATIAYDHQIDSEKVGKTKFVFMNG